MFREEKPSSNLTFDGLSGSASLRIVSNVPYASIPVLQDVIGEIILHDDDYEVPREDERRRLHASPHASDADLSSSSPFGVSEDPVHDASTESIASRIGSKLRRLFSPSSTASTPETSLPSNSQPRHHTRTHTRRLQAPIPFTPSTEPIGNGLSLLVRGVYAADEGLLMMVGSAMGGGVNILLSNGTSISTTPSPSPSPVSPSPVALSPSPEAPEPTSTATATASQEPDDQQRLLTQFSTSITTPVAKRRLQTNASPDSLPATDPAVSPVILPLPLDDPLTKIDSGADPRMDGDWSVLNAAIRSKVTNANVPEGKESTPSVLNTMGLLSGEKEEEEEADENRSYWEERYGPYLSQEMNPERCDLLLAFRFRPIAYDPFGSLVPSFTPVPQPQPTSQTRNDVLDGPNVPTGPNVRSLFSLSYLRSLLPFSSKPQGASAESEETMESERTTSSPAFPASIGLQGDRDPQAQEGDTSWLSDFATREYSSWLDPSTLDDSEVGANTKSSGARRMEYEQSFEDYLFSSVKQFMMDKQERNDKKTSTSGQEESIPTTTFTFPSRSRRRLYSETLYESISTFSTADIDTATSTKESPFEGILEHPSLQQGLHTVRRWLREGTGRQILPDFVHVAIDKLEDERLWDRVTVPYSGERSLFSILGGESASNAGSIDEEDAMEPAEDASAGPVRTLLNGSYRFMRRLVMPVHQRLFESSPSPSTTSASSSLFSSAIRPVLSLFGKVDKEDASFSPLDSITGAAPTTRRLSSIPATSLYPGARFLPLVGHIVSPNCNFTMDMTAAAFVYDTRRIDLKVEAFSLLSITLGVCLLVVNAVQYSAANLTSLSVRMSSATIGIQAIFDCWMSFLFMAAGIFAYNVIPTLITAAFIHVFLFIAFEMRILLLIWKNRNPQVFNGSWANARRELFKLYIRIYLFMAIVLCILLWGTSPMIKGLLVLTYSYWLPQIIHSCKTDTRHGMKQSYIFVTFLARILPVVYLYCCPYNVIYSLTPSESRDQALTSWNLGIEPGNPRGESWMVSRNTVPGKATEAMAEDFESSYRFGIGLLIWQVVQVSVLLLQGKSGFGPRFFVPYVFLPEKYDYHRVITIEGDRVVHDPLATDPFMARPVARAADTPDIAGDTPAASPASASDATSGADTAAGAPAAGGAGTDADDLPLVVHLTRATVRFLRSFVQESIQQFREMIHSFTSGLRFFLRGCRQLFADALTTLQQWRKGGPQARQRRRRRRRRRTHANSSGTSGAHAGASGAAHAQSSVLSRLWSWWQPLQMRYLRLGGDGDVEISNMTPTAPSGGVSSASGDSTHGRRAGAASSANVPTTIGATAPYRQDLRTTDFGRPMSEESRSRIRTVSTASSLTHQPQVASTSDANTSLDYDSMEDDFSDGDEEDGMALIGEESWSTIDCVICMDTVTFPSLRTSYMVTPCDHLFHTSCLRPWMDQKMECPTCRSAIPEPDY